MHITDIQCIMPELTTPPLPRTHVSYKHKLHYLYQNKYGCFHSACSQHSSPKLDFFTASPKEVTCELCLKSRKVKSVLNCG